MKRILIVEDDKELCNELKTLLERNGYEADYLDNFNHACEDIIKYNPDMVLLDINLPMVDGQGLLKELRKVSDVPVIMVTSQNTEMNELLCLSFGADDFVAKPYNPSILLLHIEAVFKRMGKSDKDSELRCGSITLDIGRSVMKIGDTVTELTKNEFKILGFLIKNKGTIVSRDDLMNYLWDSEEFVDDNTLTVNINRVRKKLEEQGLNDVIKTKRGQGYIIDEA
ncbi:MAG: response regulator transcription factor [Lachnospiraceae bacterium]|nr:response regulator transcription factor [Lachnospiraceae bacterium]